MPVTVGHVKNVTIADGADANLVRPSDWNSAHAVTLNLSASEVIKYVQAGTTSVSSGTVSFANSNGVSFGINTNGVMTASVAAAAGGGVDRYIKEIIPGERLTTCAVLSATQWSNRPMLAPFWMDGTGLQANTVRFMITNAMSSNRSFGGTFSAGLYYLANSTQMTLLGSDTMSFSHTASASSASYNGAMLMDFTGMSNVTMTAEGRYAMAFAVAPVSANITWMPASLYGADVMPNLSRILRNNTTAATGEQVFPWWGVYSTTTGGMPNSIGLTQINGGNSASLADFYAVLKEI